MYSAKYRLTQDDLLAFNRYVLKRQRRTFVLNVAAGGLGPGLVFFLLLLKDTHNMVASLLTGGVVAVTCSGLWLAYYRSRIRQGVAKQLSDPQTGQEREVIVSAEGIRERTPVNDSTHAWQGLQDVGLTPHHLFFHLNQVTAYIVPRSALPPEAIALVKAGVPRDKLFEC